jgi:Ran GTPase-activating protein (RanGAP) involved in mRNA processing and transport
MTEADRNISTWLTHRDTGALSIANVMGNSIGKEKLGKLQEIVRSTPILISLCGIADDATEADLSGLKMDADDAAILASELLDKGALSSLDVSSNILRADGAKALATALESNHAITVLNVGSNQLWRNNSAKDMSGIIALSSAIKDMGALSVLSLKGNRLGADGGKALAEGLKGNNVITELNIADNDLTNYGKDISGIIALADAFTDMGALSKLLLKDNQLLTKEGGKALAQALAGNSTLKELDVSSNNWVAFCKGWQGDGPGFAQELAVGLGHNEVLSSLNLANNDLGEAVLPEGWIAQEGRFFQASTSTFADLPPEGSKLGIVAICDAIRDNGVLKSLNLAKNYITAEGAKIVANAIKVTNCV